MKYIIKAIYYKLFKATYYKLISAKKVAKLEGVTFGENCDFKTRNFGSEAYLIKIGHNVQVAAYVNFINHDGLSVIRTKYSEYKNIDNIDKIIIGNNVFIGLSSIILKGTIIEDNVIVGAGSVTRGLLKSNSVYAGVPAKYICSLDEYVKKNKNKFTDTKYLNKKDKKQFFLKKYQNI